MGNVARADSVEQWGWMFPSPEPLMLAPVSEASLPELFSANTSERGLELDSEP